MLGRAKGELSGHRKIGTSRDTHFLERSEVRWLRPGQGTERKKAGKGHSHSSGESRGWNWSEHGKQTSQQGTLTRWKREEVGVGRNMKKKKARKENSLREEGRVWSGQ